MQTFGYILLIIALVLLFGFTIYEVFALVREIIKRLRKRKKKNKDNDSKNDTSKQSEKGN